MDFNDNSAEKEVLKIVVVGKYGAGKTAFIRQYVHHLYSEYYRSTIGVDFAHKEIQWSDDCVIGLQLWDVSGQAKFQEMTRMYYQSAVGALVVYDLTDKESLKYASFWKHDIDKKVVTDQMKPIPCLLLGNKSDITKERIHKSNEIKHFCERNGFVGYFEVSAKTSENVENSVLFLVDYIKKNNIKPDIVDSENCVSIASDAVDEDKTSCCK